MLKGVAMHPLKIYLFENQIKQIKFANNIGISASYFSKILKRKQFPSRKTAIKIIELTGSKITMNDLYSPVNTEELCKK